MQRTIKVPMISLLFEKSTEMTDDEFLEALLLAESSMNSTSKLRFHLLTPYLENRGKNTYAVRMDVIVNPIFLKEVGLNGVQDAFGKALDTIETPGLTVEVEHPRMVADVFSEFLKKV